MNSRRAKEMRLGIVLHAVLVVLAMAGLVASGLVFRMQAETAAVAASADGQQAYLAAASGLARAMAVVAADPLDVAAWWDNPRAFRDQLVWDDGAARWYFTIYADFPEDDRNVRYGLTDEASKINLNLPPEELEEILPSLPQFSAERVDCLLDYLDADDEARPAGAEQEYYDKLPGGSYTIRNGPLATPEELLLVKGFDGRAVFGEDANRNGMLEANENDGSDSPPDDDADGVLDKGLAPWLTTFSYEPEAGDANQPETPEGGSGAPEVPAETTGGIRAGLINVNTAPSAVLAALPGLDAETARRIVEARGNLDAEARQSPAWLLSEGLMSQALFERLAPLLTARSWQFHVRCIGFGRPVGRFRILEAIIDLGAGEPRIVHLREVTRWGLPLPLSAEEGTL